MLTLPIFQSLGTYSWHCCTREESNLSIDQKLRKRDGTIGSSGVETSCCEVSARSGDVTYFVWAAMCLGYLWVEEFFRCE